MLLVKDTMEFGGKGGGKVIKSEDMDLHLTPIINIQGDLKNMASVISKCPQL